MHNIIPKESVVPPWLTWVQKVKMILRCQYLPNWNRREKGSLIGTMPDESSPSVCDSTDDHVMETAPYPDIKPPHHHSRIPCRIVDIECEWAPQISTVAHIVYSEWARCRSGFPISLVRKHIHEFKWSVDKYASIRTRWPFLWLPMNL